ncbi:MAG: DMT family transporter [Sedimentisphaerales bacterium]
MNEHKDTKGIDITATFASLAALLFWSFGPIFIEYLTGYLDVWTQNFLRYLAACLFLLPVLILSIRKNTFEKSLWRKAAGPACANLAMQTLMTMAFYYIDPPLLVMLMKSSVIWTAFFSLIFFLDERPLARSRRFWLGMIFSIIGVTGVMYYKADLTAARTLTGVILALACGFMFAVYAISAKVAFKNVDSRRAFSVISIYTTGGLAILAFLFGDVEKSLHLGAWQWSCVIISAITAIALGHTFYYAAMRRIGATIPALIVLAQPFLVLAFAYIVFDKSLNLPQIFSGIILLTGSALAIWAQKHLNKSG